MMNWVKLLSEKRKLEQNVARQKGRSPFEQDFDRIIFSTPFRKLQDKTQVHPLPEEDFVHTRLTHSLEVSSVGRSMGKMVGEALIEKYSELKENGYSSYDFAGIVASASLAHDIGNPPFGHSGEEAISNYFKDRETDANFKNKFTSEEWADLTDYEGNAQGFRLLNKDGFQGLKLTFATLGAFSKYPRVSSVGSVDKSKRSQKKYGVFRSNLDFFNAIAAEMGLLSQRDGAVCMWSRHPLTFLVEAADDICYHIIDLEDGCMLNLVSFEETFDLLSGIIRERVDKKKLDQIPSTSEKTGTLRALAIARLIEETVEAFLENEAGMLDGTFDTALTDIIPSAAVLENIKALSIQRIYNSKTVLETELAGFRVLPGLMDAYLKCVFELQHKGFRKMTKLNKNLWLSIPESHRVSIEMEKENNYGLVMACLDFIASLTDSNAIALYRKIMGMSLPSK